MISVSVDPNQNAAHARIGLHRPARATSMLKLFRDASDLRLRGLDGDSVQAKSPESRNQIQTADYRRSMPGLTVRGQACLAGDQFVPRLASFSPAPLRPRMIDLNRNFQPWSDSVVFSKTGGEFAALELISI